MSDYGNLFLSQDLSGNNEIILARFYQNETLNSGWWAYMFGNYEVNPVRGLLQTYLMDDGTPYTNQPGYETNLFVEEFESRDPRLYQTYAYPGWELINTSTYAQGAGIYIQQLAKNFSGYHQLKGFVNDTDATVQNNLDVPILRYAETLLVYAEAKAELGELTRQILTSLSMYSATVQACPILRLQLRPTLCYSNNILWCQVPKPTPSSRSGAKGV